MSINSPRIAALVCAAGASTRTESLGEPKQLLRFGTRTLLDLALASVSMMEVDQITLVLGAHAEAIQAQLWLDEAEIVHNDEWQRGMLSTIQTGLRALGDGYDWVVMLPCDYALVERSTIAQLLLRAATSASAAPLIAPSFFGKSGHPVLLGKEMQAAALNLPLDVGLDSAVQAFKSERVLVEVDDPAIHFDIDTPMDYQRALDAFNAKSQSREAYLKALAR